jgi:hypothetical protein
MFITEVLENHEIYYKTQNRHGLSIMQSYIANHHGRLFVTVYQLYSHILQIIATDCSSRFIDMQSYITNHRGRLFVTVYRLCSHILQIIAADCSSQFINYAVIYYKSSRQTVRHALSIIVIHYKLQIIATDCSSRFIDYTVIYYKSSRQTVWQCLSIIQSYITKYKSSRQTISPRLSVLQFNTTYKVSRHDIYFPVINKNLRRKKVVFNSFKDLSSAGLLIAINKTI